MTVLRRLLVPNLFLFLWALAPLLDGGEVHGQSEPAPSPSTPPTQPRIVLIGGFNSDPSPDQIAGQAGRGRGNSGLFQLAHDLQQEELLAEYFNWNGTRAGQIQQKNPPLAKGIASYLREEHGKTMNCRLVIVGNSWGGHTAWEVCTLLEQEPAIPVELLVFLDPSSAARAEKVRPEKLPTNVGAAVNYYTRNLFVWRDWPGEERLENIDLGDPARGYVSRIRPYDASFNFSAHVMAEWDPRIHVDIQSRIRQTLKAEFPSKPAQAENLREMSQ